MPTSLSGQRESMEAAFAAHADPTLFVRLAGTYRESGDLQGAERVLRVGLRHHAGYAPAQQLYAAVLLEAGRDGEAERFATAVGRGSGGNGRFGNGNGAQVHAGAGASAWPTPLPAPRLEAAPQPAPTPARAEVGIPVAPVELAVRAARHDGAGLPVFAHRETGRPVQVPAAPPPGVGATTVATADLLVGLLEYRDPFFRGGTSLTRLLTTSIARELAVDERTSEEIALGAVLRDLGQLPLKGLISKVGSDLGSDDRRLIERHVDTALELLAGIELPANVRLTIRHHHERWDGTGYPSGLAGDVIPLGARIVAVADSFAAMIAARPHRLPKRVPAALDEIRDGSGRQYDPAVVDALTRAITTSSWRGLRFGLRHHLLIVDPDATRAMVLATRLCSHGYLAEAAFSTEAAAERLLRTRIAGLILSADVPASEAAALLREVRETSRLGMIPVIATDAGVSQRVPLLEMGADVCLHRGSSFEELKATFEAFLRREGKPVPAAGRSGGDGSWAGLQGDISDFPLAWLLQVLNYDARTAAVFLTGDGEDGVIFLAKGNPRHARTNALDGEAAFRAMLRWKTGTFSVDPDATTEEHTVRTPLMNLLLDDAVREDHAAFFGSVNAAG
jgi:response regulator RpfG family c-di-GMP phosphodiesterase